MVQSATVHPTATARTEMDDVLDTTFAALANRARRQILHRLAESPATVNELAEPLTMSLPAVSRHLKVLEGAGLIVRGRTAQYRPCALDPTPLREVAEWTDRYRPIWEASFDRLGDYLDALQHGRSKHRRTETQARRNEWKDQPNE